ncbi:MAG TPA: hypothetical protein VN968_19050 [Bradyrhizobium sp.]|jgi:hypothetical protein|nr:hypothetical protein [Bradyrhizobium sp.]
MVLRIRSLPGAAAIAWAKFGSEDTVSHDYSAILVQKFSQRSLDVLLEDLRRGRSELLHRRI